MIWMTEYLWGYKGENMLFFVTMIKPFENRRDGEIVKSEIEPTEPG